MHCKLCERWWAYQWERSDAWERAHSNESELWSQETERNLGLIEQGRAIEDTDPEAALAFYLEAAEGGSPAAMMLVGWHYHVGHAVPADPYQAQEYYRRAVSAGSWMATLSYTRCVADEGHDARYWEPLLEDGIALGFVPAYFWLARLRHDRCSSRETCRAIRPLLERAAAEGHPMAAIFLSRMMIFGKLRVRDIPAGLLTVLRLAWRAARDPEEDHSWADATACADDRA